jgi:glycosyltransferase involved in cell wall biosynthesis
MVNFTSMEYLGSSQIINQIKPLVSVCIPTFQHAKYIEQCIESVLSQETDFPFEILIGEDDSTDGTREICIRYAEKYPDRIRLFLRNSEEKMVRNGKKIGRLNHLRLYKSARGKFLCFCDGDDYWLSNQKLQLQVGLMNRFPNASICITRSVLEGEENPLTLDIPDQLTVKKASDLKMIHYQGHLSSWMVRNRASDFLKNKAAYNCPGLDVVIYSFYKKQGDVILTPEVTSFYRRNMQGSYRKMNNRQTHRKRFITNWYTFFYIHRDPLVYLRSLVFMGRRYFHNFVAPIFSGNS